MSVFLTISGLIIAVSLFLFFLSSLDQKTSPSNQKTKGASNVPDYASPDISSVTSRSHIPENLKNYMPQRRCPICSSTLKRDEPLYASKVQTSATNKVLIHGCPYCYKGEKMEGLADGAVF